MPAVVSTPSAGDSICAGQHILLGDCLLRLKDIPDRSIDVVVTSPPYNIGIAYRSYDDRMPRDAYMTWLGQVARELRRCIADNGSVFLNVGATAVDPWLAWDVAAGFRQDFALQNRISWVKSVSIHGTTYGHFKPLTSRRFLNNTVEEIFHFTPDGHVAIDRLAVGVPFQDKSNIARRGHAADMRCAGNAWFIPYETVRSKAQKFDHPAGYPLELALRCIRLHGKPECTVLDPFLGTGTTLVAARDLGCHGIGIEIDRDYAETARRRLDSSVETAALAA